MLTIYTDGASRGNPGPAAFGYVLENDDGTNIEGKGCLADTTNNVAEYTALIKALEHAHRLGEAEVRVRTDSELMVKQLNGVYKVKNEKLKPLYAELVKLREEFASFAIKHVPRGENARADKLCNDALDEAGKTTGGAKSSKKKKPQKADVRTEAIACLREVAQVWSMGNPEDPPAEIVWDQLWSILQESGVLK